MIAIDTSEDLINSQVQPLRTRPILSGVKILIVDDCSDNQFLFSHLLKRKGAVITTASNGHEGVQKALEKSFDVILMDIQMPVLDGYAALELLKKSGNRTSVIAVTASNHPEEKLKMSEAGFAAQASKPLDKDIFIQTIFDVLAK